VIGEERLFSFTKKTLPSKRGLRNGWRGIGGGFDKVEMAFYTTVLDESAPARQVMTCSIYTTP
jgi:hypothetical protein